MNAAEFILDTLSHFVTRADAPPPGVPARPGSGFETDVCAICAAHGISAVIARSLDALALPPAISRVTATRLRRDGDLARENATRRMKRLETLFDAFDTAGIPALVTGDVLSAALLYGADGERAVRSLDVLVDETRVVEVVRAAQSAGFSRRRSDPSIEPTASSPPTLREARDVLEFHHYMVPLVLHDDRGDALRLRFRAVDVGHPATRESAWDRATTVQVAASDLPAVALEDHIVDLAVQLGISRYTDLGVLTDLGLILDRHIRAVNWGHVVFAARTHGIYSALGDALDRVRRLLALRTPMPLESPRPWVRRWLGMFEQRPGSMRRDHARDRFVYGLAACGGPVSTLRWLWRTNVPRRAWVERACGDARRPWNWIAFQMFLHDRLRPRGERARNARRTSPEGDNVTRLDHWE
jgi:hypothetical protein